jgi:hypothetical protein
MVDRNDRRLYPVGSTIFAKDMIAAGLITVLCKISRARFKERSQKIGAGILLEATAKALLWPGSIPRHRLAPFPFMIFFQQAW